MCVGGKECRWNEVVAMKTSVDGKLCSQLDYYGTDHPRPDALSSHIVRRWAPDSNIHQLQGLLHSLFLLSF